MNNCRKPADYDKFLVHHTIQNMDTSRWMDVWMDIWMVENIDGKMYGCIDGWMDGNTSGKIDGWMDGFDKLSDTSPFRPKSGVFRPSIRARSSNYQ